MRLDEYYDEVKRHANALDQGIDADAVSRVLKVARVVGQSLSWLERWALARRFFFGKVEA